MEVLKERKEIYGDFDDIATVAQKIKDLYYINAGENDPVINEAFDMIAHKLARIITGGTRYIDNWRDLCGYANLAMKYIEENANGAIDSKVTYVTKNKNGEWEGLKKDSNTN
jgi:hypothetical protein